MVAKEIINTYYWQVNHQNIQGVVVHWCRVITWTQRSLWLLAANLCSPFVMPYAYVCDCVSKKDTITRCYGFQQHCNVCWFNELAFATDCSLPTFSPHISRDTMLCDAVTWSHCPRVIQRPKLLEVSLRGRENVAETTREFESSPSPVAWHICSWCSILQLTWCRWL